MKNTYLFKFIVINIFYRIVENKGKQKSHLQQGTAKIHGTKDITHNIHLEEKH